MTFCRDCGNLIDPAPANPSPVERCNPCGIKRQGLLESIHRGNMLMAAARDYRPWERVEKDTETGKTYYS